MKKIIGWEGLSSLGYFLGFIFGFLYRWILRKFSKNIIRKSTKNINQKGQILRFVVGVFLLTFAITTSWSPILLFFAGFTFFEAIFSWCGLFAALGKSTCPLN